MEFIELFLAKHSSIISIIIWASGFLILLLQFRGNLKLQRENIRITEKLKLYKDLDKLIQDYIYKSSNIKNFLKIGLLNKSVDIGNFLKNNEIYRDSATSIMLLAERYQVMEIKLEVCANALKSSFFDLNACFSQLTEALFNNKNISDSKLFIERYIDIASNIDGYIQDTSIVSQNYLLGILFKNKAQYRIPLDPNIISLNFDKYTVKKLNHHFLNNTLWGKNIKDVEKELKISLE